MSRKNGNIKRLTAEEVAALTTPAKAKSREAQLEAVSHATSGLRFKVQATPSMYGRR